MAVWRRIRPAITQLMSDAADATMDYIDRSFQPLDGDPAGNEEFPVWSGNMRDSLGVGVYRDGQLVRYKLPRFAKSGYGSQMLDDAFDAAENEFSGKNSYYTALFAGVDYAEKVNIEGSPHGRGVGFFDNVRDYMVSIVDSNIQAYIDSI